jgi:hypothetical protein
MEEKSISNHSQDDLVTGQDVEITQLPQSRGASRRTSANLEIVEAYRHQNIDDLMAGINGGVGQVVPESDDMPMRSADAQKLSDSIAEILGL